MTICGWCHTLMQFDRGDAVISVCDPCAQKHDEEHIKYSEITQGDSNE